MKWQIKWYHIVVLSVFLRGIFYFNSAVSDLRLADYPPALRGPASSAGGQTAGNGHGDWQPARPNLSIRERQFIGVPTKTLSKQEAVTFLETEIAYRRQWLPQIQTLSANIDDDINSQRALGQEEYAAQQAAFANILKLEPLSGQVAQQQGDLPAEFTNSPLPAPAGQTRALFRDINSPLLEGLQTANRTVRDLTFDQALLTFANNPTVALASTINFVGGALIGPVVNSVGKVVDEAGRVVDCINSGQTIYMGCGAPAKWQDYWATLMTGEESTYALESVVLDAFTIVPLGGTAAKGVAELTQAGLRQVEETLLKLSDVVASGAKQFEGALPALGFGPKPQLHSLRKVTPQPTGLHVRQALPKPFLRRPILHWLKDGLPLFMWSK